MKKNKRAVSQTILRFGWMPALLVTLFAADMRCASSDAVKEKEPMAETDKLTKFFTTCESDIMKAVKVVTDLDIIKSLTHLKRMDAGGKKYYLLERESLSEMIRAVTEGSYTDLILINKYGTIIYTMYNDNIFGKNVNTSLIGSTLYSCFKRSCGDRMHVEDVSVFPPVTGSLNLFMSVLDKEDEMARGVFIMQIDIGLIRNLLGRDIIVIDDQGRYRISSDRESFLSMYPFFEKIDTAGLGVNTKRRFVAEEKEYVYSLFKFENLSWIIISSQGRL